MRALIIIVSVVWWSYNPGKCYYFRDENEPTYLVVRVGHYVLLNCEVDFEQAYAVPYMVKWRKDVSSEYSRKTIFIEKIRRIYA